MSVGIRTQPKTALTTIVATAVLYNILLNQHDEMPQNEHQYENDILEEIPAVPVNEVGNHVRINLIETYFAQEAYDL